jgi:hypothetical protein
LVVASESNPLGDAADVINELETDIVSSARGKTGLVEM